MHCDKQIFTHGGNLIGKTFFGITIAIPVIEVITDVLQVGYGLNFHIIMALGALIDLDFQRMNFVTVLTLGYVLVVLEVTKIFLAVILIMPPLASVP